MDDEDPEARFRCLSYGHMWQAKPGPTDCPKCGQNYVKWLNVSEIRPDLEGIYDR